MSTQQESAVSYNKVNEIFDNKVNKDVDLALESLSAKLKTYRTYKWQLDNKRVTDLDETGKPLTTQVPVVGEDGQEKKVLVVHPDDVNKKKSLQRKIEVTQMKTVVVGHAISDEEINTRKKYMTEFEPKKIDTDKKIRAYNAHKIRLSDDAVKLFNKCLTRISIAYLARAGLQARKLNNEAKKLAKKTKITMMHMVSCKPEELAGFNLFSGKSFFAALREFNAEEIQAMKETVAKETKKELKKLGYSKNSNTKALELQEKRIKEEEEEREKIEKYKGLDYAQILELERKEKESKKESKKEKKEKKKQESAKFVFANVIKTLYKRSQAYHDNPCAISMEVLKFLEEQCLNAVDKLAAYASTVVPSDETKTIDVFNVVSFFSSYIVDVFEVSKLLSLKETTTTKYALERAREENAKRKENGLPALEINEKDLEEEDDYFVEVSSKVAGSFGAFFNQEVIPLLDSREEHRELLRKRKMEKALEKSQGLKEPEVPKEEVKRAVLQQAPVSQEQEPKLIRRR